MADFPFQKQGIKAKINAIIKDYEDGFIPDTDCATRIIDVCCLFLAGQELKPHGYHYTDKDGNPAWTEDYEQSIGE